MTVVDDPAKWHGYAALTNWTLASGTQSPSATNIELQTYGLGLAPAPPSGLASEFGNQYVELDSDAPSIIQQTVTGLTPGAQYQLSVWLASRAGTSAADNVLGIQVQDAVTGGALVASHDVQAPSSGWQPVTDSFIAGSSGQALIQFADKGTPADGQGTFIDDAQLTLTSSAPKFSVNDVMVTASTNPGTAVPAIFKVSLDKPSAQPVTVQWATADGTATQPEDYQQAGSTLTFSPNVTSMMVTVNVASVSLPEPNEDFFVNLTNPSSNASLGSDHGKGTIQDPLTNPTVTITPNVQVNEPVMGQPANTAPFTVSLDKAPYQTLTLHYTTVDGTAIGSTTPGLKDYDTTSGDFTFSPTDSGSALSRTITVPVNTAKTIPSSGNSLTFTVDLSVVAGSTANSTPTGTATIKLLPSITIGDAPAVIQPTNGTTTLKFPVTVTGNVSSSSPVTVVVKTISGGTAVSNTDYVPTPSAGVTLTFTSAGTQNASVTVNSATTSTGQDKTVKAQISAPSANSRLGATTIATGTIQPPPLATIDSSVAVIESIGAKANFVVHLNKKATQPVTIAYTTSPGTAANAATPSVDYNPAGGTVTIAANSDSATISVPVFMRPGHQADRTFLVVLSAPTGSSGSGTQNAVLGYPATGTATITDLNQSGTSTASCSCTCVSGSSADGGSTTDTQNGMSVDRDSGNITGSDGGTTSNSGSKPNPIVTMLMTLPADQPVPKTLAAQLVFPATANSSAVTAAPVYYDTTGLQPGQTIKFTLQADAASLPTGHYNYQVNVTSTFADNSTRTDTGNGSTELFNWTDSPYGRGRWIDGLDQLVPSNDGVAIMHANGSADWFSKNADGTFNAPPGSFHSLVQNGDGTYALTDPEGNVEKFSSAGLLTANVMANGQTTTYSYTSTGGVTDALSVVTDSFGRTTTYSYASGVLSTMTDFAGRVTTYNSTNGNFISSIVGPDPGFGEQPIVTSFTYDSNGLLQSSSVGSAGGTTKMTTLAYDFANRITQVTNPDSTTIGFAPGLEQGLVDTSQTGYDAAHLAAVSKLTATDTATAVDENNNSTTYQNDEFGNSLSQTDAQGNVIQHIRNADGLVTQMIQPNPNDPSHPLITSYTYDNAGDVIGTTYPDGSTESWTYDPVFGAVTSHIDQLGHKTLYQISQTSGEVLSMTQVVGQVDGQGNSESDDLTTTYSYTDSSGALPSGLLLTTTDPLGHVTKNVYYSNPSSPDFGRLESVTEAYGTSDAATTTTQYDAAGNVIAEIDPLGRETDFQYDALNRLVGQVQPAPSGSNPADRPTTTYAYDVFGNQISTTDPLGKVTTSQYDSLNRLTSQTVTGAAVMSTADLAGQWKFDETSGSAATDTSPNGDTGTLLGGVTHVAGQSGSGGALQFDGTSGSVTLGNPSALNITGQITISASVMVGATDGVRDIVARGYSVSPAGENFLRILNGQYQVGSWDGNNHFTAAAIPSSDLGTWVQLTGVYDGTAWKLYDNGALLSSSADSTGAVPVNAGWSVGSAGNGTERFFQGSIDNVNIYNRALSATEIGGLSGTPIAETTSYVYDNRGLMTSMTDPMGRTTAYAYDSLGRQTSVTQPDPDGSGPLTSPVSTTAYDALGRVSSTTDPNGNITTFQYDALGRLVKETTGLRSSAPAGLAGAWDFSETSGSTVADSSGNNDTGSLIGSPQHIAAPQGGALQLNGSSQSVALGNPSALDITGQITISAWIDVQSTTGLHDIVARGYNFSPDGEDFLRILNGQYQVGSWDGTNHFTAVAIPRSDNGNWVQLVGVYDGTNWKLYDNGTLISTTADATGAVPVQAGWAIGSRSTNDERFFQGDIGAVRIYNRGLSAAEVAQLAVPDSTGSVTQFGYDAAGNQTSMTDPLGRVTNYLYDALNRQTEVIEPSPDGVAARPTMITAYDKDGNVASVTDAIGNTATYAYDNMNRQISLTQPNATSGAAGGGPVTSTTYDADSEVTSTTDARGHATNYQYDNLGRQTAVLEPSPGGVAARPTMSYSYDAAGDMLSSTDPDGNTTDYFYDGLERQVGTVQPNVSGSSTPGPTTLSIYDLDNELIESIDPVGRRTSFGFDNLGRQTLVVQPIPGNGSQGPVSTFSYDADGNLVAQTDPRGATTRFVYDSLNRQTATIEPSPGGNVAPPITTTTYDAAGEVTSTTDPMGRVTTYGYDKLGRQTLATAPSPDGGFTAGASTSSTYDAVGNLLSQTNALNHSTISVYDHLNRQVSQSDADHHTTNFTYDATGNEISLTDPDGNTTAFSYDNLNRLVGQSRYTYESGSATSSNFVSEAFSYDPAGNLTSQTDYDGRTINYDYDVLNRRIDEKWMAGASVVNQLNYAYDAASQMLSAGDTNSDYAYGYDGLGRVTSIDNTGTTGSPHVVLTSGYDANGNRIASAATINGTADFLNSYSYDALNREISVRQQGQSGGNAVAAKRVDFSYLSDGQYGTIRRYSDVAGTSLVANSSYGYDDAGRLVTIGHTTGSTTIANYVWDYDAANRLVSFTNSEHTDENLSYSYDNAGQLIGAAAVGTSGDEAFGYDANGNRQSSSTASSSSTYVTGANNKTNDDGTYTYTYDANGNTLTRTNKSSGDVDSFSWDDRNRLVQVVRVDGNSVIQWTVNYKYDVNNELIGREKLDGSNAVVSNQRFVYDGQQIVMATEGGGNLTDRMLWGPAVDQLLAQESVTGLSSAGATNWALGDNQNTVRDWLDSTGTDEGHAAFSSYGQQTSATGYAASSDIVFAYTGKYHDPDTGLQYNENRWYDSGAGRWLSEDPIGFSAGDSNVNLYSSNAPVINRDPSGLVPAGAFAYRQVSWSDFKGPVPAASSEDAGTASQFFASSDRRVAYEPPFAVDPSEATNAERQLINTDFLHYSLLGVTPDLLVRNNPQPRICVVAEAKFSPHLTATAYFYSLQSWVKPDKTTNPIIEPYTGLDVSIADLLGTTLLQHEQGHFDINQIFALRYTYELTHLVGVGGGTNAAAANTMARNSLRAGLNTLDIVYHAWEAAAQFNYDTATDHGRDTINQFSWQSVLHQQAARVIPQIDRDGDIAGLP